MSGSKSGLAIFALLIGITGTALGVYSVFFMPQLTMQESSENSVITDMWYDESTTTWTFSNEFSNIPSIEVIITVNPNEKVFILFSAEIEMTAGPTPNGAQIRLKINNTEYDSSIKRFQGDSVVHNWNSLTLQYVEDSLTAGDYEIHIQAKSTYFNAGSIRRMNLLVYTFK